MTNVMSRDLANLVTNCSMTKLRSISLQSTDGEKVRRGLRITKRKWGVRSVKILRPTVVTWFSLHYEAKYLK